MDDRTACLDQKFDPNTMMMSTKRQHLCTISDVLIDPIAAACQQVDWTKPDYDRPETVLMAGRLIEFPYMVQTKSEELTKTETNILDACAPVINIIKLFYPDHMWVRGEVACLLPGVTLVWHRDPGLFHKLCHRVHIPIITSPQCFLLWEGERFFMPKGEAHEINNLMRHSATNGSDQPRIHLIFDLLPPENHAAWEAQRTT